MDAPAVGTRLGLDSQFTRLPPLWLQASVWLQVPIRVQRLPPLWLQASCLVHPKPLRPVGRMQASFLVVTVALAVLSHGFVLIAMHLLGRLKGLSL